MREHNGLGALAGLVDEDECDRPGKRRRTTLGEAQVGLALL